MQQLFCSTLEPQVSPPAPPQASPKPTKKQIEWISLAIYVSEGRLRRQVVISHDWRPSKVYDNVSRKNVERLAAVLRHWDINSPHQITTLPDNDGWTSSIFRGVML